MNSWYAVFAVVAVGCLMQAGGAEAQQYPFCDYCEQELGLLFNNATLRTILIQTADLICEAVPFIQEKCEAFINNNVQKLIDIALKKGPCGACAGMKLCNQTTCTAAKLTAFMEMQAAAGTTKKPNPGPCYACEFAINSLQAVLTSVSVQNDLKNLMLEGCKISDPFEVQACEDFVNNYWDTIFQALQRTINPKLICVETHICPSP